MKFVLIGSTLSGNKGAAAMLESSIQTLSEQFPNATFSLLSYIPAPEEQQKNPYKNLEILKATPLYLALVINPLALLYRLLPPMRSTLRKNQVIKAIAEANVLLDQGGITFVDGREKFLLYNVASILPALFMKTKVVKCAQALGPFNKKINRVIARMILPRVSVIVARGAITHQYLQGLGLKNVIAGADYAFLLELTEEEKKAAQKRIKKDFFGSKKVVGIAPSTVLQKKLEKSGKDYRQIMIDFTNELVRSGKRVVLIPHSARLKSTKKSLLDSLPIPLLREIRAGHTNDLTLCREIYAALEKPNECLFIDDELPSQELRYLIGECDYFVAARFHAMVSSLAMSVPTLVVGWSHKYEEVLDMFDLKKWAFGNEKLTNDYLLKRFSELEKNKPAIQKKLNKYLLEVKKQAYKQVDAIIEQAKT